ncbi:MAG TPA: potassium-transporting ATPase subunit KdpA, partial [Thermoplasmata archaeon]|nr:potassium-transporting ATPase subunit KdpA [Thermoplasmata archaeon]
RPLRVHLRVGNNGSALSTGQFNDTTLFFNVAGALVMLVGRFVPILAMLKVADLFSHQEVLPAGVGPCGRRASRSRSTSRSS